MTAFEERPHSPYYGCADATALYVVLLDEYERWTGDRKFVRELEREARAALNWIDEYADLLDNGYVWYQRRNEETGLENQCWKDSWDSISYSDGRLPGFPRATAELQGTRTTPRCGARLARLVWKDPVRGRARAPGGRPQAPVQPRLLGRGRRVLRARARHRGEPGRLARVEQRSPPLERDRREVEGEGRGAAPDGAAALLGLGRANAGGGRGRYPIGYHVGTVWPFDNSFIAWGLRNYGFKEEAAAIAAGILDAAVYFQGRLPEAFGGYERSQTKYPVQYPTACSPQAWSTGTRCCSSARCSGSSRPVDHLIVDPVLPTGIGRLELLEIPGRWGRIDAFARGRVQVEGGPSCSSAHPDRREGQTTEGGCPNRIDDRRPDGGRGRHRDRAAREAERPASVARPAAQCLGGASALGSSLCSRHGPGMPPKWSTESRVAFAEASADRASASRAGLDALELRNFDSSTFEAWFAAFIARNKEAMTIAERRFRPAFRVAFDAWRATKPETNQNAPRGPTFMPQYRQPGACPRRGTRPEGRGDVRPRSFGRRDRRQVRPHHRLPRDRAVHGGDQHALPSELRATALSVWRASCSSSRS